MAQESAVDVQHKVELALSTIGRLIAQHDLAIPYAIVFEHERVSIKVYHDKPEVLQAWIRALTTLGDVEKKYLDPIVYFRTEHNGYRYEVVAEREAVCKRVAVGTRRVERPKMVQDGTEFVEEVLYKWDCGPVLDTTSEPR